MKTESEENQEHECALTERGSEMKRKENYLKQLEKQLQCKENEIRTRLKLYKVAVEESLTEAKRALRKASQMTQMKLRLRPRQTRNQMIRMSIRPRLK